MFRFKDSSPGEYLLRGPDGERELRARGTLVIDELAAVGAYELLRDGETLARFAVHFGDDAESDLRSLGEGERLSYEELAREEAGSSLGSCGTSSPRRTSTCGTTSGGSRS